MPSSLDPGPAPGAALSFRAAGRPRRSLRVVVDRWRKRKVRGGTPLTGKRRSPGHRSRRRLWSYPARQRPERANDVGRRHRHDLVHQMGRRPSRQSESWRPRRESNPRTRICSPLRNHSATRPLSHRPEGLVRRPPSGRPARGERSLAEPHAKGQRPLGDLGKKDGCACSASRTRSTGTMPPQGRRAKKCDGIVKSPARTLLRLGEALCRPPIAVPDSSVGRASDC